jgi:hypothetical protein
MKIINTFLLLISLALLTACAGPEGVPGKDGYDGLNGKDGLLGTTFENKVAYNFTLANNYSNVFTFPRQLYKSDVILVFRLVGVEQGKDVWKSLPETYFNDNGTRDFTYNFDFTQNDVLIKLFGANLSTISDKDRLNQIFRIVIIPSDFSASVNKNNYKEVISALKIKEKDIQKVSF